MSKCVTAISSCHSAAVNCKGKRKLTILPNTDQTIPPIHSLSSVPLAAAAAAGGGGGGVVVVVVVVVGCWRGYLSGAMCRFAYGPADATATHRLLLQ